MAYVNVSGWIAFDNIRRIKRALAGLAERARGVSLQ